MRWVVLCAWMMSACAHTGVGDVRNGQLVKWSERSQSVTQSGPVADGARLKLAKALTQRGHVVAAGRLYVEVLAAKQSPTMMVQAQSALESLIWTHQLPPHWLALGLLETGEATGQRGGDAGLQHYLSWVRLLEEGRTQWAQVERQKWEQHDQWQAWHKVQLIQGALAQGQLETARTGLGDGTLETVDGLKDRVRLLQVDLAWQEGDYPKALRLLERLSESESVTNEVDLQRGWVHFQMGNSGKAIAAARMILRRDAPLVRRVEAAKLEAMVWLDSCQSNRVDQALDEVQRELGEVVQKIGGGARAFEVPEVVTWMGSDPEQGALFALHSRAERELETLKGAGLAIPAFERYVEVLGQTILDAQEQSAWRVAKQMDVALGELRWLRQQQVFVYPDGPRPSWSPKVGVRTFADVPQVVAQQVLYPFDGEVWSDERHDQTVLGRDRCETLSSLQ